ncbi:hypothetical protein CBR_g16035 [Chara braunii]|uniref:RING-type E3 ubiquitin transferase n=1 Tax=Chara braunii TaxID=69332 RepID=A0A388JSX5_CHABU|nr:hypothetical protein CBR_g16035 [Chara braunii]|eukprot:GBG60914.1 hypothetical protein CBR_g16035 [Chara braunii]
MKLPTCSVCQMTYNEDDRAPMMLTCGHSFCKECLAHLFAESSDHTLPCPRCRQISKVGNSVEALRKNFGMLSLIRQRASGGCGLEEEESDSEEELMMMEAMGSGGGGGRGYTSSSSGSRFPSSIGGSGGTGAGMVGGGGVSRGTTPLLQSPAWSPVCNGSFLEVSAHNLRFIKMIGSSASRPGQEVWVALLTGNGGCRHKVAVKKMDMPAGVNIEWITQRVDNLRRATMWCQNVCTLYGVCEKDGKLCIVMEKHVASVQMVMRMGEGRLTVEQILRYGADIARGVAELHAAGVMCMNLKPPNFLIDKRGRALVADFALPGILKQRCWRSKHGSSISGTSVGLVVDSHNCHECTLMTPNYMAPEAWQPVRRGSFLRGDDVMGMSSWSDAWAFGCALVEMCTGVMPWDSASPVDIERLVVKGKRQPPEYFSLTGGGIPRELRKLIGDCLNYKPTKRPTFHAMLSTFLTLLKEIPISVPASPDNDQLPLQKEPDLGSSLEPSPNSTLDFVQGVEVVLHRLVSEGDVSGVRDLLNRAAAGKAGVSVAALLESRNVEGQTVLHTAAMRGFTEIVELILEHPEADVEAQDKDGDTPIFFAVASGMVECLQALAKKGADVNARLKDGLGPTVAVVCAFHGHPDCMRELLLEGADPNTVDDEGATVLHRAVAKGHTECAVVVLENGGCRSMAIPNAKGMTPLHLCASTGEVAVVRRWLELATAEEIQAAIEVRSMATLLRMAATLKKGLEKEARELVSLLLTAGADPTVVDSQRGQTALHAAAIAGDREMVEIILDAGVDVDIRDVHFCTPLHDALSRGRKDVVGLLLERGADCNAKDDDGNTTLHIAAEMAVVQENLYWLGVMLQREDADVDCKNHSGQTVKDLLEGLPREWISEDLEQILMSRGIVLAPTIFDPGDWVTFRRFVDESLYDWGEVMPRSVGLVLSVDKEASELIVTFCGHEMQVSPKDVRKIVPFERGQHVRVKAEVKQPRYGWRCQTHESIGTILCIDEDGVLRVGFAGAARGWKADPADMERADEYKVGDWVKVKPTLTSAKHGLGTVTAGSIGVVYSIRPDHSLLLDLCYLAGPWLCEPEEVDPVEPFKPGERVCVKRTVAEPRYAWGGETHHSVGKISEVSSDGLLMIDIPGRPIFWQADPADMERVEDFKVGDWVRVKATVSSPKYGWEDVKRTCIGVVHCIDEDGDIGVGLCFRMRPFPCSATDLEKVVPFEVGQEVRIAPSVVEPRLTWQGETAATSGRIARIDMDGTLNVRVAGRSAFWRVAPGDAEKLCGFEVGDWVRAKIGARERRSLEWQGASRESVAVVHSVSDTGYLEVAGCFRSGRWMVHAAEVEKVLSLQVGQHVRVRRNVTEPRWGWRGASHNSRGVVVGVHADGEVRVAFPGLASPWRSDPADLERETMFEVGTWVRIREDLVEPRHGWNGVRPGSVGVVQGVVYENDCSGAGSSREVNQENAGLPSAAGAGCGPAMLVAFCGRQERWIGLPEEMERVVPFRVGQTVRVKPDVQHLRFGMGGHRRGTVGTITGIDADGRLRLHSPVGSTQKAWMLDPAEAETVEPPSLQVGDWVSVCPSVPTPVHQWGEVTHKSIGVIHRIDDDGDLWVAFAFLERLWVCKPEEMIKVEPFRIGQHVRVKRSVVTPRWGWGIETYASRGVIAGVDADAKLRVRFARREGRLWVGDPADIELDPDLEPSADSRPEMSPLNFNRRFSL